MAGSDKKQKDKLKHFFWRYFLTPFLHETLMCVYAVLRFRDKNMLKLADYRPHKKSRLLILGNGPSLNRSIEKSLDKIQNYDLMCVNFFALYEYFETLRPQYYVLADPVFGAEYNQLSDKLTNLINVFQNKTSWNMVLFMPENARKSVFAERLENISNIKIVFYNKLNIFFTKHEYAFNKTLLFKLLAKDLISPPAINVLCVCEAIGIYYGYKQIFLIGADHSWHEEFKLDQKTNDLYISDTHFYSNQSDILLGQYSDDVSNLGINFSFIAAAMNQHQFIKEYAQWKGVQIFNASEKSWIDVFERKELV